MARTHHTLWFSLDNAGNADVCCNADEPQRQDAESDKPRMKGPALHTSTRVRYLGQSSPQRAGAVRPAGDRRGMGSYCCMGTECQRGEREPVLLVVAQESQWTLHVTVVKTGSSALRLLHYNTQ